MIDDYEEDKQLWLMPRRTHAETFNDWFVGTVGIHI